MLLWVTVKVVPVGYVALAAVEIVNVPLGIAGMAVIVTVSGFMIVAVNVSVAVAVAGIVNVKLVALLKDVRTASPGGIPLPLSEIAVPARNDMVVGETIVTMALPFVMLAVKVIVVVVVFGIPVPLMVIPCVKSLVEAVVTVVLPLVVSAVIVEDNPVLATQMLFE